MFQVIFKNSFVQEAILIFLLSLSTFFIIFELASIASSRGILKISYSMPFSVCKLPVIDVSVCPIVIPVAIGQILLKCPCVSLSVIKSHSPVSPFHKIFEFAFISRSFVD